MLEEFEARREMTAACGRGPVLTVPLREAEGGFLLEDFTARVDMPGFDNSMVDGYALGAAGRKGDSFRITGEQAAGPLRNFALAPGESVRIFTGAAIPDGTVAVLMREDALVEGETVTLTDDCEAGEHIRRQASDFEKGSLLASRGARIHSGLIALLAAQGMAEIPAVRAPVVGVMTCGDEVVAAGDPLWPGAIYESNSPMLTALLRASGVREIVVDHALDDPDVMRDKVAGLLVRCDFLFTVGGVSVGDRDYVRGVMSDLGVVERFWRVKVKPGKPMYFGLHRETASEQKAGTVVIGLPGNPVSAWTTCALFGLPCIAAWRGAIDPAPGKSFQARAAVPLKNPGDRPHYLRGILQRDGTWAPSGLQRSDALRSLALANSLARLESGAVLEAGDPVDILIVGDLMD